MRLVYGLLGMIIGVLILKYSAQLRFFFGASPDLEARLGGGGTRLVIVLLGLAVTLGSMMYLIGYF